MVIDNNINNNNEANNKSIDIHNLNMEELNGVVSLYPWYGAARKELCVRMARMGSLTESLASESALYLGSRRMVALLLRGNDSSDYSDPSFRPSSESESDRPRIFVVGGDYFSQSQYDAVKRADDGVFSGFAVSRPATTVADSGSEAVGEDRKEDDFYTETLAKIYLEQDYPDMATEIYSKLSLRYPEKSVYFAALIDEINKNNKQI